MKQLLIIGAQGQLGKALSKRYPEATQVDKDELDITDLTQINEFNFSDFDYVINAAAYTNVDGAELDENKYLAWQINAEAVANISHAVANNGGTLVHISTDYVYDGIEGVHTETESLKPLNNYGRTKAAGDLAVESLLEKYYILRTSWVIGDGANFVKTMLGLAGKDIEPKVVNDQIGRLTFTSTLTDAIDHLITTNQAYGTYNVTNSGDPLSWAGVTEEIYSSVGKENLVVTGVSTEEYFRDKPETATRPLKSTLDLSKLEATGFKAVDWRKALADYIGEVKI